MGPADLVGRWNVVRATEESPDRERDPRHGTNTFRTLKFGQEIVRSSGSSWSAPRDFVVEWRQQTLSFTTSRRFSALARCTSRSTHPDEYSGEVAVDLAWSDQSIRSRMLPG